MIVQAGLIACRFLHFASLLSLFGLALYPLYAIGKAPDESAGAGAVRRLTFLALCVAALAGGLGWFAFTTASMAGVFDAGALWTVLTQTDFGPLWAGRLALIAAMALMAFARLRGRPAGLLFTLLAAAALASLAGTGHARTGEGPIGALHVAADAVHLLAAGGWIGGLFALGPALLVHRPEIQAGSPERLQDVLRRFSGMGSLAVAALLATGILNGWLLLGSVAALWSAAYGELLAVKIALFGAMVGLAAVNRFWLAPGLGAPNLETAIGRLRALRRQVIAEQALGVAVVAIVSVLGTLQTPV